MRYVVIILVMFLLFACNQTEDRNDEHRFRVIYEQGSDWDMYVGIIIDNETGNKYIIIDIGYGIGVTEYNE